MNIIRNNKALCMNGTASVTIGRILANTTPRMKSRKYSLKHGYAMHEHKQELVEQKSVTGRFSSRNFAADYGMGEAKLAEYFDESSKLAASDWGATEARIMAHYADEGKEDGYGMNFERGDNYDN